MLYSIPILLLNSHFLHSNQNSLFILNTNHHFNIFLLYSIYSTISLSLKKSLSATPKEFNIFKAVLSSLIKAPEREIATSIKEERSPGEIDWLNTKDPPFQKTIKIAE
jgi:hypothetical protein